MLAQAPRWRRTRRSIPLDLSTSRPREEREALGEQHNRETTLTPCAANQGATAGVVYEAYTERFSRSLRASSAVYAEVISLPLGSLQRLLRPASGR